jgi:hypothetical protein
MGGPTPLFFSIQILIFLAAALMSEVRNWSRKTRKWGYRMKIEEVVKITTFISRNRKQQK